MGFLGFETKKEKEERIKREQEEKKRNEAIEKMPIYYSSAVDFKYMIVRGDLQYYTLSEDITDAWEKNIRFLKKEAYECNADCVIDVKIKISGYVTTNS